MLAGFAGDGCDASLGRQLLVGGKAGAIIPELGQDLGGVHAAAQRQRLQEGAVRVLREGGGDGRRELLDLGQEREQHRNERADDLPAGFRLEFAGLREGRRAQAREEIGDRPAATVRVLGEELREAFLAEPLGAVGGGIAAEEGEGDGRRDIGEDRGGPGPEALEQGPELIGEGAALDDEIVAAAHQGAEGARRVGQGLEGAEAMAVGAEQIGEDEGVARITLAARRRVAGPTGLERVGMDGDDRVAGVHEDIDDEARGAFDGDGEAGGRAEARQLAEQLRQAVGRVLYAALPAHLARRVEDGHGVLLARPVEADGEIHCTPPGESETLRGERSCRSLTARRSGLQLPWRDTLWPVWASRYLIRGSGSHRGRRTASTLGSPRTRPVPFLPRMSGFARGAQEIRSRIARRIDDRPSGHTSVSPRTGLSSNISGGG